MGGEGGLPLLAGGVPDLRLNGLVVDHEGARLELDPDGGLGVEAELVAREPRQDLRLAHRRVADQHHLEYVVHLLPARRHRLPFPNPPPSLAGSLWAAAAAAAERRRVRSEAAQRVRLGEGV
jgi:hypothetical protein